MDYQVVDPGFIGTIDRGGGDRYIRAWKNC
jgi:hypothetical protein